MSKVAFYTRISTDESHQKYSLGAQKDRLEAYCHSQYGEDWRLTKVYTDAESGTHLNRPGLQGMLADAQSRSFDTLLVFRVDRLSRKVRELALLVDELTKHGITLRSITEPFDTANAAGKMMLQMLGVFAEFEHATIVERTKVGMEKKAKGGTFVGGVVPYGYRLEAERGLVVDTDEAAVVKKMFDMYTVERLGSQSVSKKLNAAGERKRSGKLWDRRVILHILQNQVYTGKLVWRGVTHNGTHKAIIPTQHFDRAQRVLQERRGDLKGRQWHNNDQRLLTGLIRCRSCRSHMFGGGARKKDRYIPYYVCSKRFNTGECDQDYIRADRLETVIMEDIKTIFRDPELMSRIREKVNRKLRSQKPGHEKQLARLESQCSEVQARLDRYFEAFETGTMKPEICGEKVQSLTDRLEQLQTEKQTLEGELKQPKSPALDHDALASLINRFDEVIATGTKAQRKHVVGLMVKSVSIHHRDKIEVVYQVPNPGQFERVEHCNKWLPG